MIKSIVEEFLEAHLKDRRPLLLGYSGGPDSRALLELLLECKESLNIDLHLAHVDHGWRKESAQEAEMLRKEAEMLKLPFHLKRLNVEDTANLENRCRELRFNFFEELFCKHNFQALLLAHQADDVSETVIKRIFEGADISFLGGIAPKTQIGKLTILRPLLRVTKKELLDFLEAKKIPFLTDRTNKSPKFLRSKMRNKIFPFLEKEFGKNIQANLLHLGFRAQELKDYLDKKTDDAFTNRKTSICGTFLDFKSLQLEDFETKYLIKRLLQQESVVLSRNDFEQVFFWLNNKCSNKIFLKEKKIIVKDGILFILRLTFVK